MVQNIYKNIKAWDSNLRYMALVATALPGHKTIIDKLLLITSTIVVPI